MKWERMCSKQPYSNFKYYSGQRGLTEEKCYIPQPAPLVSGQDMNHNTSQKGYIQLPWHHGLILRLKTKN
jgi:hypothetical protein